MELDPEERVLKSTVTAAQSTVLGVSVVPPEMSRDEGQKPKLERLMVIVGILMEFHRVDWGKRLLTPQ